MQLKCSGDSPQCQRCMLKKLACTYSHIPPRSTTITATPAGANTNNKAKDGRKSSRSTRRDIHQRQNSLQSTALPLPSTAINNYCDDYDVNADSLDLLFSREQSYSSTPLNDFDLGSDIDVVVPDVSPSDGVSDILAEMNSNINEIGIRDTWEVAAPSFGLHTASTSHATSFHEDNPFLNSKDHGSGDDRSASLTSPNSSKSGCDCLPRALSLHESLEVTVWDQKKSQIEVHEVLQHQKKAVMRCEELLECQRCSVQSSYVMLVLTMCRVILDTLQAIGSTRLQRSTTRASISSRSSSLRGTTAYGGESEAGTDSHELGLGSSSRWNFRTKRQLDDEDEDIVLQSLLSERLRRLATLLERLNSIICERDWPAHKCLLREMSSRMGTNDLFQQRGR